MTVVEPLTVNANILLWIILTLITTTSYILMLTLTKPANKKPQPPNPAPPPLEIDTPQPTQNAPTQPTANRKTQNNTDTFKKETHNGKKIAKEKEIEEKLKKMEETLDKLIESLSKQPVAEDKQEKNGEEKAEEPVITVPKSYTKSEIIKAAEDLKAEISKMVSLMKR